MHKITGYNFKDESLLEEALSHPSVAEDGKNYERLEFLGDAVLSLVVSEMLYTNFPDEKEGALAKRRSALVCGETLSKVAQEIGLGEHIRMGVGEDASGGRENPANLENAMEAVIAALYLDGGLEVAREFVLKNLEPLAQEMTSPPKDPKTHLQEWAQARGLPVPEYRVVSEEGPSHEPVFTVEVGLPGYPPAQAQGASKRKAEREAAANMLSGLPDAS